MGDDNQFLKQKNKFRSDFMEHFDAKVNHILEMISNMQEHLQTQERNKGEEIRNDFSVANPQLHKLPLSPHKVKIELQCLSLNPSSLSFNSQNTKLEDEGFVEVPIHTTVVELQFEESKSEAENQSYNTPEIQQEHKVFAPATNQKAMAKGVYYFIEETTKGNAHKVFDEMIDLEMEVVCEIGMEETKLKVFDYFIGRNFDPGGNAIPEVVGKFGNNLCSKNCSCIVYFYDSDHGLYVGMFGLWSLSHSCDYRNDSRFSKHSFYPKMPNYYGCDGCLNEEFPIEELIKIFGESEVEKEHGKFSPLYTSQNQIGQDAKSGDTNMLIPGWEKTKAELALLRLIWIGTYDKTTPHFWVSQDRPRQYEDMSNIKRIWEKKRIEILWIQSAIIQPPFPNCSNIFQESYIFSMRVNHQIEEFNKWSLIVCDTREVVVQTNLRLKILQHITAWRQRTIKLSILGKEKMSNRCNYLITAESNSCFKCTRSMQGRKVLCYIGSFWKVITSLSLIMLIQFLKPKIQKRKDSMRDLQELISCKHEYIFYFYGGCEDEDHRLCIETKWIEEVARIRFLLYILDIFFGVRTQLGAPEFDSGGVNDFQFPELLDLLCEHYFYFNNYKTSSPTLKTRSPTTMVIQFMRLAIFTIPCFMMWLVFLRALRLLCGDENNYSILVKCDQIHRLYLFEGLVISSNLVCGCGEFHSSFKSNKNGLSLRKYLKVLLSDCVTNGVKFHKAKVWELNHEEFESLILCDVGAELKASLIVDVSGFTSRFIEYDKPWTTGYHMTHVILAEIDDHPFNLDTMVLMDWRDSHLGNELSSCVSNSRFQMFLYAVPFDSNLIFLEELSLVSSSPMIIAECLGSTRMIRGASLYHRAWNDLWLEKWRCGNEFYNFGMETLLKLDLKGTMSFFDTFLEINPYYWHGFMSSGLFQGVLPIIGFATVMFVAFTIYSSPVKLVLDKYLEILLLIVVGVGIGRECDQLLSKPPLRFQHLSRGDTTHSRGEYCCGNGGNGAGQEGGVSGGKFGHWARELVGLNSIF